jgi:acyl-CoA thioesterase
MFAGGAVGAVGLLSPLHAVSEPIAIAIASRFIRASRPVANVVWSSKRGRTGKSFAAPQDQLVESMMLLMPAAKLPRALPGKLQSTTTLDRSLG